MSGPSFFGEVLPLNSRAGEVDADFETDEPASYLVSSDPEVPMKLSTCKLLILAHGEHACCYVKAASKPTNHVAHVVVTSHLESSSIYRLDISSSPTSGFLLVSCPKDIPAEHAYEVVELVMTSFSDSLPEKCLILCSKAAALHRGGPPKSRTSILYSTNGSKWSGLESMSYLTTPNTIDGLPAAALTFCELHKMAAIVLISWYQSTGHSDLVQAARSFDSARKLSTVDEQFLTPSAMSDNFSALHPKNLQYFA